MIRIKQIKQTITAARSASCLRAASLAALLAAGQAQAGLMLETYASNTPTPDVIGGYAMTDFTVENAGCTPIDTNCDISSVALPSPLQGEVRFVDYHRNELFMNGSTADETDWWVNGEADNYDIYTTHVNWVELILPENTRAFSFNVGASFSGWGWMVGFRNGEQGYDVYETFHVSDTNTPGFGVYADNSDGSCGSISSVIIDPREWGVGNLSINVGECEASVAEPGVMSLLALGLFGLGLARTRFA